MFPRSSSASRLHASVGTFVEEHGQVWDRAVVEAGSFAIVFKEWFGKPHVGPWVRVGREHGLVLVGHGALQGKVVAEGGSPFIKPS